MIDLEHPEEPFDSRVAVRVTYTSGFSGINVLILKKSDVAAIADMMLGGDGTSPSEELDEIHLSAVQEAMNQMIGSAASSMSTFFNKRVDISPPTLHLADDSLNGIIEEISSQTKFAKVSFQLKVGSTIDSTLTQLIPLDFAKDLVKELLAQLEEGEPKEPESDEARKEPAALEPDVRARSAQGERGSNSFSAGQPNMADKQPSVHIADFSNFDEDNDPVSEMKNLDVLLDIPLQVTVELGRTRRSVKEILELGAGAIIELDKLAGEPVDILINNRPIAKGEVVVIDENFGVRVTNILSKKSRIERLN
jgi:flagellar motor switch protein FliN/FliY